MSPAQKPVMQTTKIKSVQKVKLQTQSTVEHVKATPTNASSSDETSPLS